MSAALKVSPPRAVPATDRELRAVLEWASTDDTRPHLDRAWRYGDPATGETHVATDGHTMCVRRHGSHVGMKLDAIEKATPEQVPRIGCAVFTEREIKPPVWATVCVPPPPKGEVCLAYSYNPSYLGRLATIERVTKRCARDRIERKPGESVGTWKMRQNAAAEHVYAILSLPSNKHPLDGLYWWVNIVGYSEIPDVKWEGVIMPRRI
jgi:hypothetical protein